VEARADVTFLMPDGTTIVTEKRIPPASRYNIWVDFEGATDAERAILSNTAVSTTVRVKNGVPVVVERALWWPGSPATWHEAHASAASDRTSTRWLLAEGESGGVNATETYVLVANTSPHDGQVRVTLLFEDGTTAVGTYGIGRNSRLNVNPQVDAAFSSLTAGRRYAVLVESSGATPVELRRRTRDATTLAPSTGPPGRTRCHPLSRTRSRRAAAVSAAVRVAAPAAPSSVTGACAAARGAPAGVESRARARRPSTFRWCRRASPRSRESLRGLYHPPCNGPLPDKHAPDPGRFRCSLRSTVTRRSRPSWPSH
jgi:hypothetical protein